jgi:hypothetical protein
VKDRATKNSLNPTIMIMMATIHPPIASGGPNSDIDAIGKIRSALFTVLIPDARGRWLRGRTSDFAECQPVCLIDG